MGKPKTGPRKNSAVPEPKPVANDSEEDEEIEEDEAFDSEDEKKYGAFFKDRDDDVADGGSWDEEEESDDDDVDEEDEGDGGEYMLSLLDKLSGEGTQTSREHDGTSKLASHVKESAFASSVLPSAGLTLETLMDGLKDSKDFRSLSKQMKPVAMGKAIATPLARPAEQRLERTMHYNRERKKISSWKGVVAENREAETLDFRPQGRLDMTKDVMVEKFEPKTDFEKELEKALEKAGQQDEETMLEKEEKQLTDDLGSSKITLEQFKERRSQLAKMRALMFYHEVKRHHINKIKSKKYRRIRKRQREKQKAAELVENPELVEDLEEKEQIERIQERMTLAHKNTSKWARRILKRGKNVDVETRRALSAQLQRGDDLLKKMNGGSDDEGGDSDEDLAESARKVLEETETTEAVPEKGLFKLAFMKRGVEKQRQRAKEEARQLLMELEADNEISGTASESEDEMNSGPVEASEPPKAASKKEMESILKPGDMKLSTLAFGNTTSVTVSEAIPLAVEKNVVPPSKATTSKVSQHQTTISATEEKATRKEEKEAKRNSPVQEHVPPAQEVSEVNVGREAAEPSNEIKNSWTETPGEKHRDNPWMIPEPMEQTCDKDKKSSRPRSSRKTVTVNVDRAADLLDPLAKPIVMKGENHGETIVSRSTHETGRHQTGGTKPRKTPLLTTLTQEELVRRAFTESQNSSEQVAHEDEEFAREKQEVIEEEEAPLKKKRARELKAKMEDTQGWGSWAGEGVRVRFPGSDNKSRKKNKKDTPRNRRDADLSHVIIRERRLKQVADVYMLQDIPYPYTSREEYELAMSGGIGKEWNVHQSHKSMTRRKVVTRAGKIIQPIPTTAKGNSISSRQKRPGAKF